MFAEVAFPIRSFQTFTYSISVQHISSIVVGTRVSVPFRNKIIQGIVVKIKKIIRTQVQLKELLSLLTRFKLSLLHCGN